MTRSPTQSEERPATENEPRRTVVEATGLSLTFETADGPVHALSEVDLRVEHGDFISLIGPSGCGKTTLLRAIADLEQPTAGRIEVNGVTPHQARLDRSYGYIFQAPALYPWRNIERNVTLPLEIMGLSREERAERAREYLELVDLAGFEKKFPWQLSGGMQQRASIARAVLRPGAFADGRTVRCARRDRPRSSQRTASETLGQDPQDRGVRHPLDPRGGLFVDPDRGHVAAPGKIIDVIETDFPRDRSLDIRDTRAFLEVAHRVREGLRAGHSYDG